MVKQAITTKKPVSTSKHVVASKTTHVGAKVKYIEAVGRRKTAIARVRVYKVGSGKEASVAVNDRPLRAYFSIPREQGMVVAPFKAVSEFYEVSAKVSGGGINAQAEAVRLGIARALTEMNPDWRSRLKSLGFLKRDPRMVERKKYGSRKARRPQQWRKR